MSFDAADGDGKVDEISTRQQFAAQLTVLREQSGRTVREVARMVNLPSATIGDYFAGRHLPPVRLTGLLPAILAACGVTDPEVIAQWQEVLRRIRRTPGPRPADAPVPYRGLEPFQAEHADWFRGREQLTELLLQTAARSRGVGPVMVVGASGSGKSSLLRAGLVAKLREAGEPRVLLLTPGSRPLTELAKAAENALGLRATDVQATLREDPRTVGRLLAADGDQFVIVVDQFEEVFTACSDEGERDAFIHALQSAAADGSAVVVACGLRADFYEHASRHPDLAVALQRAAVVVGPMTADELRRAVTEPAALARVDIEEGLVEVLLRDLARRRDGSGNAAHDAGTLPLLSHVLLVTWERGRRRGLTLADYGQTGGIDGAVAGTAEDVYAQLTLAEQDLARQIFMRLVHVNDDGPDTRRRATPAELPATARPILDQFIKARLITAAAGSCEISHEALLVAWPRLRGWLEADRDDLRTHRQLAVAAGAWQAADRDTHMLYRGGRLEAARAWTTSTVRRIELNDVEREFLQAGIGQATAEARAVRRRTRRLKSLLAAVTALSILAGVLTVFALRARVAADSARDTAISRELAIKANQLRLTDVPLASQLALAAYRIAPTVEARSSLLSSYSAPGVSRVLGPAGVTQAVAISPDGTLMAAGGPDFRLRLYRLRAHERPTAVGQLAGHANTIFAIAFTPDSRTVISAGGDHSIRLWSVDNPSHARLAAALTDLPNTVYSIAVSPDGTILAAGLADRTLRLWRIADRTHPASLGEPITGAGGAVQSVAISPSGAVLAAGSADGVVRLWDMSEPTHVRALGQPIADSSKTVFTVAFAPDGRTLAAGSADNSTRVWSLASPNAGIPMVAALPATGGWVNSIAFSGSGRILAAGSSDEKVWLYDTSSWRVTTTLPHPAPVTGIAFVPGRDVLATSAADGTLRLWDPPGPVLAGATQGVFNVAFGTANHVLAVVSSDNTAAIWDVSDPRHPVRFGSVLPNAAHIGRSSGAGALSPNARTLAIGNIDGSVQLWDITDADHMVALPERLLGHAGPIEAIAFSPNGKLVAISSDDHTVSLWDITDPRRPLALSTSLTGFTNYAYSPTFSPDGQWLAASSADKTVRIWHIADPRHPEALAVPLTGPSSYVFSIAFSPTGRTLAVSSADNTIRFWDVTDPGRPRLIGAPLQGPENYIYAVAYSPDGGTLAAAAGNGTIWLWDVANAQQPELFATLTGHLGSAYVVGFDTDRDLLASGGADGIAHLWDIHPTSVADWVCATTGDPITPQEWHTYVPALPYRRPCIN